VDEQTTPGRASPGAGHVLILRPAGTPGAEPPPAEFAGLPVTAPPPSRPASARARRAAVIATALVLLGGLLAGWLAFLPHRDAWVGHNGDHFYYASTALQYAGVGYDASLTQAADYFHYPMNATALDLGYLDPAVAPLIYPRVVLGLLALPVVQHAGVAGIWFPGILCGALGVLVLLAVARRTAGLAGLAAVPVLIGVTRYAPEFMFGIYQEAPLVLATALLLAALPLGSARRTWWHAVAAAGLVPVMLLCRQVPVLPVGMVLGGWLWAWVGGRRARNAWLPFAVTVPPVTAVSYVVLSRWAPYDALPFLYQQTGTHSVPDLMDALPTMWQDTLRVDWAALLADDRPMIVVTAIGLVGLVLACRNPLAGVFLGSLASGVATELLNGQPNAFRYLAPSLPPLLLLAALAVAFAGHGLRRAVLAALGPGRARRTATHSHVDVPPEWAPAALSRPEPRRPRAVVHALPDGRLQLVRPDPQGPAPRRGAGPAAAALSWLVVAALTRGAVAVHPRAEVPATARVRVSALTFGHPWPLGVTWGTLSCGGGDYQIWLTLPGGARSAVSGTAMAASPGAPTVLDLASEPFTYGWPEIKPLLTQGMALCGAGRPFGLPSPTAR